MARLLDRSQSEYLTVAQPVVSSPPWSLVCWFRSSNATVSQNLIVITDDGGWDDYFGITANGSVGGDPLVGFIWDGVAGGNATTTTGYSINTWHHAAFVGAATNDRAVFIDGGSKGTNAVNSTPASLDRTLIGAWGGGGGTSDYLDGRIAEVAIWNAALADDEVAILARGYSPVLVHPQNLVAYWPLIRDEDQDRVGGYDVTPINTPSIAAHAPVLYPHTRHVPPLTPINTIDTNIRWRTAYKSQDD